ncbi:hypothetical protein AXG93_815s1320 [Marchantia polymorpha subsp. ruderalis]|uniref:Uncharacterized protein n=1 Tax=Marchantia polymorpha subsp. ruderalis TaxID=1480154 RepID=A0A176W073_MARPO|nr:hypothetical protein AXG93_815s1320 [Marchantia polymorpha subsp. ruderalis]
MFGRLPGRGSNPGRTERPLFFSNYNVLCFIPSRFWPMAQADSPGKALSSPAAELPSMPCKASKRKKNKEWQNAAVEEVLVLASTARGRRGAPRYRTAETRQKGVPNDVPMECETGCDRPFASPEAGERASERANKQASIQQEPRLPPRRTPCPALPCSSLDSQLWTGRAKHTLPARNESRRKKATGAT